MKILVIGSSAREHAIVWKLQQSHKNLEILCSPGNAGIAEVTECLNVAETDIDRLVELALVRKVDLTIVGSPQALAMGIADRFKAQHLRVFGPSKEAAELDWSRYFAKEFAFRHKIPSPKYASFDNKQMALVYAESQKFPCLIKSDGLRNEGSMTIVNSKEEATLAVEKYFPFGNRVIIEEYLEGQEATVITICDGSFALSLPPAQDHTNAQDGDLGPATDGMGAYAPNPVISTALMQKIRYSIIDPTVNGMRMEGKPYMGALSFNLIIDKNDDVKLVDYKSSFTDPETQVVLPLFDEDLAEVCLASAKEDLSAYQEGFHKFLGSALCVNLVSAGYPENCEKGKLIDFSHLNEKDPSLTGAPGELEQVLKAKSLIFHGATRKIGDAFMSDGGRVISATAVAENLVDAQVLAYKLAEKIDFDGKHYRRDIGDSGMV